MHTIINLVIAYHATAAVIGAGILAAGAVAVIRYRRSERRWLNATPARNR